jgi:ABC-type glycerol-3-phosphate transport system substrate-binding protein
MSPRIDQPVSTLLSRRKMIQLLGGGFGAFLPALRRRRQTPHWGGPAPQNGAPKAEAEVTFYSSLQASDSEPFLKAFNKRYPFLKVNTYRISGQKQVIRIQTELNAGRYMVDVTNGSSAQAYAIKKIGALDPYHTPQRQFFVFILHAVLVFLGFHFDVLVVVGVLVPIVIGSHQTKVDHGF